MPKYETTPFQWWHSNDQERWDGPCDTREEAIAEARSWEHRFICQANQRIVHARDLFDITRIVEDFDNDEGYELADPDGDGLFDRVTGDQWVDLEARIAAVADAWQEAHGLSFPAFAFHDVRNEETLLEDVTLGGMSVQDGAVSG